MVIFPIQLDHLSVMAVYVVLHIRLVIWVCRLPRQVRYQAVSKEIDNIYPAKKFCTGGVRLNSVLIKNDCIKCYILLFKEIILQQFDAFQTEIQGSLTKLCAFKVSRGHSSKMVKLPIMSPGAEIMEYLNNP